MININNKFELESEVFYIEKRNGKKTCRECNGSGYSKETHTGVCPTCQGTGLIENTSKKEWVISNKKYKINKIKVNVLPNGLDIYYKINNIEVSESNIFKTLEDAVNACELKNKEESKSIIVTPINIHNNTIQ